MRIIGIDPGLAIVGFAIIDLERGKKTLIDVGVIRTAPELSISERLLEIYKDMEELLKEYKPEHCSIEQIFFSNNVQYNANAA